MRSDGTCQPQTTHRSKNACSERLSRLLATASKKRNAFCRAVRSSSSWPSKSYSLAPRSVISFATCRVPCIPRTPCVTSRVTRHSNNRGLVRCLSWGQQHYVSPPTPTFKSDRFPDNAKADSVSSSSLLLLVVSLMRMALRHQRVVGQRCLVRDRRDRRVGANQHSARTGTASAQPSATPSQPFRPPHTNSSLSTQCVLCWLAPGRDVKSPATAPKKGHVT